MPAASVNKSRPCLRPKLPEENLKLIADMEGYMQGWALLPWLPTHPCTNKPSGKFVWKFSTEYVSNVLIYALTFCLVIVLLMDNKIITFIELRQNTWGWISIHSRYILCILYNTTNFKASKTIFWFWYFSMQVSAFVLSIV